MSLEKHSRLQVFKRAEVPGRVFIHDDLTLREAAIGNLSAGGVFLKDITGLSAGTPVRVTIKARGLAIPVQAMGRIVRVEATSRVGLAVEFTSISSQSRNSIQSCVHEARLKDLLTVA